MNDRPIYPTTVEEWIEKNKLIIPKGATMKQIVEQIENDFDIPTPFRMTILANWYERPEQQAAERLSKQKEKISVIVFFAALVILVIFWMLNGMPIHW